MNTVHVREYDRRKPAKPEAYRNLHNRLVEEVEFLESLRLQDELAEELEEDLYEAFYYAS